MTWKVTEDNWKKDFCWFLVDEGKIQYAFKKQALALKYQEQGYFNYMLLTNLNNIINDTMLDPREISSWHHKVQTCIDLE